MSKPNPSSSPVSQGAETQLKENVMIEGKEKLREQREHEPVWGNRQKLKEKINYRQLLETNEIEFEIDKDTGIGFEEYENGQEDTFAVKPNDVIKTNECNNAAHPELKLSFFNKRTLQNDVKTVTEDKKVQKLFKAKFRDFLTAGDKVTDDGGIIKQIDRPGNGKTPPWGAKVWIHYIVYDESQELVIDSSRLRNQPFSFKLFSHDVLAVLEYGVATMEVKEQARFLATPQYAYGPLGIPNVVNPNANCLFDIELLDFLDDSFSQDLLKLTSEERAQIGFQEMLKAAIELKDEGNKYTKQRMLYDALKCYRRGIHILERYVTVYEDQLQKLHENLFTMYNNMAQCYLDLKDTRRALYMCSKASELPPDTKGNRCKLAFRQAKAQFDLGNIAATKELARRALDLEPGNACVRNFYEEVSTIFAEEDDQTVDLYKRMTATLRIPNPVYKTIEAVQKNIE